MSITKGKHIVSEIEGVRCTIVETDASMVRMEFLKGLLEFNGYEVKVSESMDNESVNYTVGVTDLVFNPIISVYERTLKTKDGHRVSPAYWDQKTTVCDPRYWRVRRKV
jgi:hypothetical protein